MIRLNQKSIYLLIKCVDLKLQVIIGLIRFIVTRYTDSNLSMVDNKTSIKVNQLGQ